MFISIKQIPENVFIKVYKCIHSELVQFLSSISVLIITINTNLDRSYQH